MSETRLYENRPYGFWLQGPLYPRPAAEKA